MRSEGARVKAVGSVQLELWIAGPRPAPRIARGEELGPCCLGRVSIGRDDVAERRQPVRLGPDREERRAVPDSRARVAKRRVQRRKCTWLASSADGPCWSTTTSQRPDAISWRASPWFQWSSRLNPPTTTLPVSSARPPALASAATSAGRSFVAVRLFPTKRTRSGVSVASDCAPGESVLRIHTTPATATAARSALRTRRVMSQQLDVRPRRLLGLGTTANRWYRSPTGERGSRVDGKLNSNDGVVSDGRSPNERVNALRGDLPLLFGIVTLLCLLSALTLSAYGHRPALMLPIAIACAVVFVRNGDGRQHWTPASAIEPARRERHTR